MVRESFDLETQRLKCNQKARRFRLTRLGCHALQEPARRIGDKEAANVCCALFAIAFEGLIRPSSSLHGSLLSPRVLQLRVQGAQTPDEILEHGPTLKHACSATASDSCGILTVLQPVAVYSKSTGPKPLGQNARRRSNAQITRPSPWQSNGVRSTRLRQTFGPRQAKSRQQAFHSRRRLHDAKGGSGDPMKSCWASKQGFPGAASLCRQPCRWPVKRRVPTNSFWVGRFPGLPARRRLMETQ